MSKNIPNTKSRTAKTTILMVGIAAILAVLTAGLHGMSFPQSVFAAAQSGSPSGHDTDCIQSGPGNVNLDKNCNQSEDSGTDNSNDA